MIIQLPSSPTQFNYPLHIIGHAGRYDTVTDCAFLDDTHIVCADRQMARLYLIEFDISNNTYDIKDTHQSIINGTPQHFDLIHVEGNTVYAVCYSNTLFSCRVISNKFCQTTSTVINQADAYHGVARASPTTLYLTNVKKNTIIEYNPLSKEKRTIVCIGGIRIKDVDVIDADHIIAISSDRGPITGRQLSGGKVVQVNAPYDSHLLIYNKHSDQLLDKFALHASHVDSCTVHDGYCYTTCTDMHGNGYILRCMISNMYHITDPAYTTTADFPHGICIRKGLLAYTSYRDSTVVISRLSDLQFSKYSQNITDVS